MGENKIDTFFLHRTFDNDENNISIRMLVKLPPFCGRERQSGIALSPQLQKT